MPITTMSDLQNGYRAMRQVIEEHPDSEAMKKRFEELFGEFRERTRKARQERNARVPLIDLKTL
jgi:hypothetical protein